MMTNSPYQKKDEQLFAAVQKLKDGDASDCNEVYVLSEKYIYKIINDIVKNHHTTEDLMQEAYIQIYNKIDTLQEVKAFYVWAGRIATNLTLRYIQKNSKEVLATPDEEGETDFIFDTASEDNEKFIPETVLVDREKQRLIAEIIDNLSTEQKICIQYFYYEEMSVNEIAEAMGCSAGTIKSRLNYARKSIKEAVVELDEKHGTRLYSLASAPLFLIVFRAMAEGLLPAAVGAASAVSVGGVSALAGGASASTVGGASASVAGNAAGAGGASAVAGNVAGSAATDGILSASTASAAETASAAGKAASAIEKGASAGRIEEVKKIVLEKLKKIGTDLKTDAKKAVQSAKEMGKTNSQAIKTAFEAGKKEGFKQMLQSVGTVLGTTAKGFGASTLTTKITSLILVGAVVVTPIVTPNTNKISEPMMPTSDAPDVPIEDSSEYGPDEEFELMMDVERIHLKNGQVYYRQHGEMNELYYKDKSSHDKLYGEYGFDIYGDELDMSVSYYGGGAGTVSYEYYMNFESPSVIEQESKEKILAFGEQFWCVDEYGDEIRYYTPEEDYYSYESLEHNDEMLIEIYGKEYIWTITHVDATTSFGGFNTSLPETGFILSENREISLDDTIAFRFMLVGDARLVTTENQNEHEEAEIKEPNISINETVNNYEKYGVTGSDGKSTSGSVTDIADPSEMEGITIPELETTIPTVEPVSDMETLQAMLYEKYALFDNVTDEIVYERMSDVPCTVYLDDGSVHSVTLAECMFRDWSGYADVDRIEYDEELAQEIFSSYTKRTDSLID